MVKDIQLNHAQVSKNTEVNHAQLIKDMELNQATLTTNHAREINSMCCCFEYLGTVTTAQIGGCHPDPQSLPLSCLPTTD